MQIRVRIELDDGAGHVVTRAMTQDFSAQDSADDVQVFLRPVTAAMQDVVRAVRRGQGEYRAIRAALR